MQGGTVVVENRQAPRLAPTETLHSFVCDQCGEEVVASAKMPAKVWAVLVYKKVGMRRFKHQLTCSEECGEAMLVITGLEGADG